MPEYKYILICLPADDSEAIYEEFHRKYAAECRYRQILSERELCGAYIHKVSRKIVKYYETEKIIKLS